MRTITSQLPKAALIGRLGGDEFVAVAPGYDERRARMLADALSGDGPVRVSTGVAVGTADGRGSFAELLAVADRELYLTKGLRRNRPPADEAPPTRYR